MRIRLGCEVTRETVTQGGYSLVVTATGSRNLLPGFLRGAEQLVTARDTLEGKVRVGRNAVVVGGGSVGCETADFLLHPHRDLSARARRVTLIEMDTVLDREDRTSARALLMARLMEKGCNILTGARVVSVSGREITYEQEGQLHTLSDVDTVISAAGFTYETQLQEELEQAGVRSARFRMRQISIWPLPRPICWYRSSSEPRKAKKKNLLRLCRRDFSLQKNRQGFLCFKEFFSCRKPLFGGGGLLGLVGLHRVKHGLGAGAQARPSP